MTLRCDHCRGDLGMCVERYCQMRFCSPACTAAYRERLADGTKIKIGHLTARGQPQMPGRLSVRAGNPGG
jgi:hypothetical protein